MKHSFDTRGSRIRTLAALGLVLIALLFIFWLLSWRATPTSLAQENSGAAFLPLQMAPLPTPTIPAPTPTPGPPAQFVKNIPLPKAQCPNNAGFNRVSGIMYVANIYSDSLSVFYNREFVGDISTGEWPRAIASDPDSSRSWVTTMHTGTALFEGTAQIGMVPRDYEPYSLAFNPINGYVYVTDLNGSIQVIDGATLVKTINLSDPVTGDGGGWILSIIVDPHTGLVYASSWEYGRLYVIEGTEVIDSMQLGAGPANMAFDDVRGLIYVAHSAPNELYPHDISVVDVKTLSVSYVDTSPGQLNQAADVVVDVRSGLAYVTNPKLDSVTILDGTTIVGKVGVGEQPWGIGVNPNDGYVFVTNRESNDVSILLNGALLATVEVQGKDPFALGVDTNNNDIYILNRGEKVGTAECRKGSVTILH
jgi:DNA-binding beta-propeller fold protein YncE